MTVSSTINIVYIGAGSITFGVPYEPWNHSLRVDKLLGERLNIVAIIDPNEARVKEILDDKSATEYAAGYANTQCFANIYDAHDKLKDNQIDLFIIGAPPYFRGTTIQGRDLESEAVRLFGSDPVYFLEKPVSSTRPDEPNKVSDRLAQLDANGVAPTVGVGYMTRYLKVVQKAIQILRDRKLTPTAILARYTMAYEFSCKKEWWAKSGQGGPAVEQMTHFCDMLRYVCGEPRMDSVQVTTVEHDCEAGGTIIPPMVDENKVEPEDRVPRVTCAQWKYSNGALASFTHIICLHGKDYSDEITILANGHQLRIQNVYTTPVLLVRDPENEKEEVVFKWDDDDMFYNELRAFISVAARKNGKPDLEGMNQELTVNQILSPYQDACKTYELTWQIRDKGDEYAKQFRNL